MQELRLEYIEQIAAFNSRMYNIIIFSMQVPDPTSLTTIADLIALLSKPEMTVPDHQVNGQKIIRMYIFYLSCTYSYPVVSQYRLLH